MVAAVGEDVVDVSGVGDAVVADQDGDHEGDRGQDANGGIGGNANTHGFPFVGNLAYSCYQEWPLITLEIVVLSTPYSTAISLTFIPD